MRKRVLAPLVMTTASALVRLVGGCSVDALDIEGKRCPCVAGFTCDLATSTCVAGDDAGSEILDAGPRDAPPGAFVIEQFGASWRTSKSVRWSWQVSGEPADFAEYQLIVGGSEDAVIRQDSTTALFDRRINPELGNYNGRDPLAGGTAKAWTVTDRHNPKRKVFARLVIRDKAGRENVSNIVSAETIPEESSLVLFGDVVPDGAAATPGDLKRVTNDCFSGTSGCLQIGKIDCGDAATCGIEMGVQGFDNKSVSAMKPEQFATAFVEVGVRGGSGASPKPHADLILTVGAPSCRINGQKCRFRFDAGWSFRPGAKEYRLVQVPLSVLLLETTAGPGPALRWEDLEANNLRIDAITIHGEWKAGVNIGLDHAHVRW